MKLTKEIRGITLIALVITIIVLLILAGVALATLTGNSSIIDNANYAVTEYNKSANSDQNVLNQVEDLFAKYMGTETKYTITYNSNGGTGTMEVEQSSRTGINKFVPPEGKVFKHWNVSADGSGTSYREGAQVSSDVTLYAIWATKIEQQYGNLVNEQNETVTPELFEWEPITEPGVAVIRHNSNANGVDGIVSRGDTPTATTLKGTAKITGINWEYFASGDDSSIFEVKENDKKGSTWSEEYAGIVTNYEAFGSTGYTISVKTNQKMNEIKSKMKKLIIPYEVTKEVGGVTKTYTVTDIDAKYMYNDVEFKILQDTDVDMGSYSEVESGSISFYEFFYGTIDENESSYLIIPSCIEHIGNINIFPCEYIVFAEDSNLTGFGVEKAPKEPLTNIYTKSIILPNDIQKVGKKAFSNFTALESIIIPDSVTEIGESAFEGCSSLKNVTMPRNLKIIGPSAFKDCGKLENITIPSGVTYIGGSAFSGCRELTNVVLPNGIKRIDFAAFFGCAKITSMEIPDSVIELGTRAFSGCKLTSLTIPNSVTKLGSSIVEYCTTLTSIVFPENMTEMPYKICSECTGLESITIPDGVTNFGIGCFYNCTGLKTINYKGVEYRKISDFKNALTANGIKLNTTGEPSFGNVSLIDD